MVRELAALVEAVQNAGTKVRELVRVGFEVQTKHDRSPVTTVDHEVNRILHEMQRREFPQDGWLSEESPDDLARLTHARVWIVDPIDGTKALVNRMPEFCISAALVERGTPIIAAILNPSTRSLGPIFFSQLQGAVLGAPMPLSALSRAINGPTSMRPRACGWSTRLLTSSALLSSRSTPFAIAC